MADELQEIDDINLDEFNFDDLPDDLAETPVDENAAAESTDQKADDFDFGDLSSEDFNFDDILSDNAASDNVALQQEEVAAESNDENLAIEEVSPKTEVDEFEVQEDEATVAAFDEAGTGIEAPNMEMEAGVDLPSDEERQDPFFEDKTEESEVAMDTALFDEQDASAEQDASVGGTALFDEQNASVEDTVFDDNDDVVPTENEVPLSEDLAAEELPEEVEQNNTTVDSDLAFEETMVEPPLTSDDNILPDEFSNDEIENAHEEFFAGEEVIAEATPLDYDSSFDNGYSAAASIEEPDNANYLKWYSGHSNDKMFEVGKGFESGNFDADEERKTLHVNVGYDTYGWEVQFSDGVVMNLRDVREYQIRNGRLPNPDGRLIYGRSTLLFSGVERIVVYESVKYFSYGI